MNPIRRSRRRLAVVCVVGALAVTACGSDQLRLEVSTAATSTPSPSPTVPAPTPTVVPAPTEPVDPWEVVTITAGPDTGEPHPSDGGFRFIDLYDAPEGQQVWFDDPVLNPTYFGSELTLLVTEGTVGDEWVKVQLPVRPNSSEAWVRTEGFTFDTHRYHATVDLSEFRVQVFEGDELIIETAAVIGRESAPTPVGRWYLNDKVPGGGGAYGPWILSLSAFSETVEVFNGGLPVIAIHGTDAPQYVGQALSSGCVRVPNDIVEFLVDELPLGTPVDIVV